MEPPSRAASQLRLDDDGRILADELACFSCGYNLRGLSPDGACPECGTAVERSTRGNLLRTCDPRWVGQLASGMKFLVASIALAILLLAGCLTSDLGEPTLAGAVQLIPPMLMLIGYWKLTTPDPGQLATAVRLDARRVTRAATVTAFVLSVPCVFAGGYQDVIRIPLAVVLLVAGFASFIYARQLAIRIPNIRLANYTRWAMWGWAASFFVGVPIALAAAYYLMNELMGMLGHGGSGAGTTSAGDVAGTALVLIGAFAGIAMPIIAILTLALVISYLRAFNQAADQARATWAAQPDTRRTRGDEA